MNFLKILFLVVLVVLTKTLQASQCSISENSCEFYQCYENEVQCGLRGYPLKFGLRMCNRYLGLENQASENLRNWYQNVRYCLQEALQKEDSRSCRQIHDNAFRSHFDCYVHTGFCELSMADQARILRDTGLLQLLHASTIRTGADVSWACLTHQIPSPKYIYAPSTEKSFKVYNFGDYDFE